jgi:hypothetical protein
VNDRHAQAPPRRRSLWPVVVVLIVLAAAAVAWAVAAADPVGADIQCPEQVDHHLRELVMARADPARVIQR